MIDTRHPGTTPHVPETASDPISTARLASGSQMNFNEHAKIATVPWSNGSSLLARRLILPSTSARFPLANVHGRPTDPPTIARSRGGLSPKTLRRVQDHVAANLGQKITNQALAQVAKLSPSHFARAFKDSQGVAPHRYILECRVKRIQELLATDLPLSELAVEVGFSDQSHLTRWFREFVGVTPGSYRCSMR
jgi:transcriptional regulator GlxA family with amidase domain